MLHLGKSLAQQHREIRRQSDLDRLEMTGLQPESDVIIEIATIVTDKHLEVLAEGPVIAIHQSDAVLGDGRLEQKQHGSSGLIARVRTSLAGDTAAAERATLEFLEPGSSPGARRCAATASARIGASSRASCRASRNSSTTAISTSARSRSWRSAGRRRSPRRSRRARRTWRSTTCANRSRTASITASTRLLQPFPR
jgi:hypothetical protein